MASKIIPSNYGSIAHLSTSKMSQQADKKITKGQEEILTKKARDWRDLIIVTEKIDGSNVGILKKGGKLIPISRAGYSASDSPHKQHIAFEKWVCRNYELFLFLSDGYRICGEWCIQAHGTMMNIYGYSPFVAFDIIDPNNKRIRYFDFIIFCERNRIPYVPILHIGQPISIKNAISLMGDGHYGNPEKAEGVVYRCERNGEIDFLAKWVRSDKDDGKYLDSEIRNAGSDIYWD